MLQTVFLYSSFLSIFLSLSLNIFCPLGSQAPTLAGLAVVLIGFFAYEHDELWPPSGKAVASGGPATAARVSSGDGSAAGDWAVQTAAAGGTLPPPTGLRRAASDGDGGESSARKTKTQSFQERMVLVPLPTAGHAQPATARPALAVQQTPWAGQRRRQGYAAVGTVAAAVLRTDEGRPSEAARRATELV